MRKVLLLGSSTGSIEIIKYLRTQDIYLIVSDYLPVEQSPAKMLADEIWDISTADVDLLYI